MKKIILSLAVLCSLGLTTQAQDIKLPKPSQFATLKQDFSTSFIEIQYSRPSANGRTIYGDLVPFGKVWRTGANNATVVTFGEDVMVAGKMLKAGSYSMYTIPNEKEWEVIFNSNTGGWGSVKPETDVLKVKTDLVSKSSYYFNTLNIDVNSITNNSCEIVIAWENTVVTIPVKVDNEKMIVNYYEDAINKPQIPYYQAASYYLSINKNLDKAVVYADKALEQNPKAFWIYSLKGKILKEQGKTAEAIKMQQKAVDMSAGTPYADDQVQLLKSYK